MRIFIGLTDVANITANYTKGFKTLGHQVFSVTWNKSYFYPNSEYDLVIDERRPGSKQKSNFFSYVAIFFKLSQLIKALNCDLFIVYAPAVLPTQLYYPVLKLLNKKIISIFWGSDIRYWYAFSEEMKSFGVLSEMLPVIYYMRDRSGGSYWDKVRTVTVAEKYSDVIMTQPDTGQLLTRPYMRANIPLDLAEYEFVVPGRKRPLILHAPSVPEAKGTDIVLNVIKELEAEGLEFDFKLIEKMPNSELRKLLTESDIVVDELYSATVGGLSAEAMATGNVVLVRYMEDFSKVPTGCPAVNVNIYTLKDSLRQLIVDVERRKELANRGRAYVESANDNVKICQDILDWVANKDTLDYDFYPTFYKNLRIPEDILKQEREDTRKRRFEFFGTLLSTGTTKKKQG